MSPLGLERRRHLALGAVLVLLAGAGVANHELRASRNHAAAQRPVVDSAVSLSFSTVSNAWYCAGPLPIGGRPENSAIALENVSSRSVSGELVVSEASGTELRESVTVRPNAQSDIALPTTGKAAAAAASVLLDGGGVGVSEIVHGSAGVSDAPCADHAAATGYLAAGGSRGANNVSLSVFDPGATPAVVSVSFVASGRTIAPPQFQGLPVPAGGVVVLDVGHYVPQQVSFSTTVTSSGGWVVAGEQMSVLVHHTLLGELVTGTSAAASNWWFAPAPAGTGVRDAFAIANPGASTASVRLSLFGGGAPLTQTISVPGGDSAVLAPVPASGAQSLRFAEVTTASSTPVVVERETLAGLSISPTPPTPPAKTKKAAAAAAAHPYAVRPITRLLGLAPGFALSAPVERPVDTWVLPGGESDTSVGESVLVANPSASPVTVSVTTLAGASTPQLAKIALAPYGCTVIDAGAIVKRARTLPLVVTGSAPVLAGTLLYVRGSMRSLGFSASVGIPEG